MSPKNKFKTDNLYRLFFLSNALKHSTKTLFMLFFLWSTKTFAQQEIKNSRFSIHGGVNSGILSGGVGPSFSLNYAIRTQKVLQLETMLFFDRHTGSSFLSGYAQENWGTGLTAGLRVNFFPQKNWNPSLLVMGGVMYSAEKTSKPYESEGVSGALSVGASINLYQRHIVSLGLNSGENISSLFLKYGYSF